MLYAASPSPAPCAQEGVFSPEFYSPYALALQNAFLLCCALRDGERAKGLDPGVCSMTYRLKSPTSISEKLLHKGLPVSPQAAGHALRDVSGLRVVLSSTAHVYRFAALLCASPMAQLSEVKDYIKHPKPSGYQSLHLIVHMPITLHAQRQIVPVEVQLRTAAMDIWANIEHGLIYKPVRP